MSWFKSDFSKSDWEEHVEQQLNLEQKEQLVHVEWLSQFALKCLQLLLQRGIYNKARNKNTWTENYSLEKINKEISNEILKIFQSPKYLSKAKIITKQMVN